MGVKDLWQILAPVCERKSLWELQDKTVAVDLSAWVCDSQNVVEHSSQPNMHLRNLFFRTSALLTIGARPIFVLEGDAPELKLQVMSQRNAARGLSQATKNSGKRSRYKGIQKKCQEMLKCMGVHCVQSFGEAEALCAILNANGVVDGCISQDSDCFLYGGLVVYRNFTISASTGGGGGPGFSIDMYRMKQVEELLNLSRTKLIGMSLLCGCDYNQGGVSGVGKESAVKFLGTLRDAEVFSRFSQWRTNPVYEQREKERSCGVCDRCCHIGKKRLHDKNGCELCGTSKSCLVNNDPDALINLNPEEQRIIINELNIRKKALQDENFPSQEIIDEFCSVEKMCAPKDMQLNWSQPNLIQFMKFAEKHLRWDECYSLEKFLPLVTRWLIVKKKNATNCPIYPETILKSRVLKGVASFEVKWSDKEGLFETLVSEECSNICLTIEPKDLFERAYPELVKEFHEKEAAKKASKPKSKSKAIKSVKAPHDQPKCPSCGRELPSKKQKCMCLFVKISSVEKENKTSTPDSLEDLLDNLSLNPVSAKKVAEVPSKSHIKPSKSAVNSEKLKMLLGNVSVTETTTGISKLEKNGAGSAMVLQTLPSPGATKKSTKFSFENLLEDEDWSIADFAKDDEGDLSDIVQSITGKCSNRERNHTFEVESTPPPLHRQGGGNQMNMDISEDPTYQSGVPELLLDPKCEGKDFSDEEAPYTPLIDRIRMMQENQVRPRRPSAVAAIKLRRFSESFNAFCLGDNATSSPKGTATDELSLEDTSAATGISFSLGITNLLEKSNQ